jgi:hypothetical protein
LERRDGVHPRDFFLSGFGLSGAVVATLIGIAFALATGTLLSIGG